MRKLNDTNRTRKRNVRHSRDGRATNCVYLSSGELYSMTGETPECRDLSEFY